MIDDFFLQKSKQNKVSLLARPDGQSSDWRSLRRRCLRRLAWSCRWHFRFRFHPRPRRGRRWPRFRRRRRHCSSWIRPHPPAVEAHASAPSWSTSCCCSCEGLYHCTQDNANDREVPALKNVKQTINRGFLADSNNRQQKLDAKSSSYKIYMT